MPYWDHKTKQTLQMQCLFCFVAPWALIHWGENSPSPSGRFAP